MKVEDIFQEIRLICTQYPAIKQVWIFGSHARGDATERSDIDLAVLGVSFRDPVWHQFLEALDNIPTLRMIDCHNLEIAPKKFKEQIFKEGKILYERNQDSGLANQPWQRINTT